MASALALQCSTNWAMKTHILGAGQFIEFILTRDLSNLSNCKFKPANAEAMGSNPVEAQKFFFRA